MNDEPINKDEINPFIRNNNYDGQSLSNNNQKDQTKIIKFNRKRKDNLSSKASSFPLTNEHSFSYINQGPDYKKQLSILEVFSIYLGFSYEIIERSDRHTKIRLSIINEENSVIFELKYEYSNKEVVEYIPISIKLNDPDEDSANLNEKLLMNYDCVHNLFKYFYNKVYPK